MNGMNLNTAVGRLVVVSGPSGVGKQTVINGTREAFPNLGTLVTATTRAPRPGEVDGVDYHFLSRATFEGKILAGQMVEWNEYAGNFYGTPKASIESGLEAGRISLGDVDINGVRNLKALYGDLVLYVQLLPPGDQLDDQIRVLTERILGRSPILAGTPTLEKRLATARDELVAMNSPEVACLVYRRIVNLDADQAIGHVIDLVTELALKMVIPIGD